MNPKPNLIFHIGVHKTATTTIQSYLNEIRPELLAHRIWYFNITDMRGGITQSIQNGDSESLKESTLPALNHGRLGRMIFSDEEVSTSLEDYLHGSAYHGLAARMKFIVESFPGWNVHFVCCIRNPATFVPSLYCECIRHYPYIRFSDFARLLDLETFSWSDMLSELSEFDGPFTVLPYEEEYGGGLNRVVTALVNGTDKTSTCAQPSLGSYHRKSFTAEEVTLFDRVCEVAGARATQSFVWALENRGPRFGDRKFAPFDLDTVEHLTMQYIQDLADLRL